MSHEAAAPAPTMVQQLVRAWGDVATDERIAADRRRALMYAEAVDEADEADALFRFGPRLQACLAPLGLELSWRGGVPSLVTSASSVAA